MEFSEGKLSLHRVCPHVEKSWKRRGILSSSRKKKEEGEKGKISPEGMGGSQFRREEIGEEAPQGQREGRRSPTTASELCHGRGEHAVCLVGRGGRGRSSIKKALGRE